MIIILCRPIISMCVIGRVFSSFHFLMCDRLFGNVVCMSDYHPRGPGYDSRLYPRNVSGSIGSGTGSTQPREANWELLDMRSNEIRLRKLKLSLRYKRFANHKVPVLPSGSNHLCRSWPFGAVALRIYFYVVSLVRLFFQVIFQIFKLI